MTETNLVTTKAIDKTVQEKPSSTWEALRETSREVRERCAKLSVTDGFRLCLSTFLDWAGRSAESSVSDRISGVQTLEGTFINETAEYLAGMVAADKLGIIVIPGKEEKRIFIQLDDRAKQGQATSEIYSGLWAIEEIGHEQVRDAFFYVLCASFGIDPELMRNLGGVNKIGKEVRLKSRYAKFPGLDNLYRAGGDETTFQTAIAGIGISIDTNSGMHLAYKPAAIEAIVGDINMAIAAEDDEGSGAWLRRTDAIKTFLLSNPDTSSWETTK